MLTERWREITSLYHSACELKPEKRQEYLERACSGDEALRREVESLLANDLSHAINLCGGKKSTF